MIICRNQMIILLQIKIHFYWLIFESFIFGGLRAIALEIAKQKKELILLILTKKTLASVLAKSVYISKSATVTVHICMVMVDFYILFIYFFLFSHILSLPLTLSLQSIIFATNQCNPASPTTHRPTIANKPTTTTHHCQPSPP